MNIPDGIDEEPRQCLETGSLHFYETKIVKTSMQVV